MTEVVAAGIEIAGVVPPLETTGEVPVTEVTKPDTPLIVPPVIATALASWVAIVPTPVRVWVSFQSDGLIRLVSASSGMVLTLVWVTMTAINGLPLFCHSHL